MLSATGFQPFHELLERLRALVIDQIAQGEATERSLARRAGISQSHLHNVLKGIRTMTPEMADRLMGTLQWTLAELDSKPVREQPPRT